MFIHNFQIPCVFPNRIISLFPCAVGSLTERILFLTHRIVSVETFLSRKRWTRLQRHKKGNLYDFSIITNIVLNSELKTFGTGSCLTLKQGCKSGSMKKSEIIQ